MGCTWANYQWQEGRNICTSAIKVTTATSHISPLLCTWPHNEETAKKKDSFPLLNRQNSVNTAKTLAKSDNAAIARLPGWNSSPPESCFCFQEPWQFFIRTKKEEELNCTVNFSSQNQRNRPTQAKIKKRAGETVPNCGLKQLMA
jgi:hypothetical protein